MREGGEIMVVAPGFSLKMSLFHSSAPELLEKGGGKGEGVALVGAGVGLKTIEQQQDSP